MFASPKFKTLVLWEYHILPGHRLLSLLAERSSFSLISSCSRFFLQLQEAFIIPRGPSLMISARLITSSAQLRTAALYIAYRSAASCGAVHCAAVRCCFMLRCASFQTYSSTRYRYIYDAKYQVPGYPYVRVFVLVF